MKFISGRKPSPLDVRDFRLTDYIRRLGDLLGSKSWEFNHVALDQGNTPYCAGFARANWGICAPTESNYSNEDGERFYQECKAIDGDKEDGTTIRSLAKSMLKAGVIDAYAFAFSVNEVSYWLLNKGPLICGTDWTESMFAPDENNIIHPIGQALGGHAFILTEKTSDGLYGIQNSWDNLWGINGKSYISIDDFSQLLRQGGEVLAAVELPVTKQDSCITAFLRLFK